MIDFAKEAMDLKQALADNAYPAADGSADIDNHALPIIEVTLRNVAGRRDAEIESLRATIEELSDKLKAWDAQIFVAVRKNERLLAALWEVTTNGRWTEGEQRGEWAISSEVYETARDELAGVDEQLSNDKG